MMKLDKNSDFYKNKSTLVLGGAGFIGSNLAERLVKVGAKVFIIDALSADCGGKLFNISEIKDKARFFRGDVKNLKTLPYLLKKCEIVFNCMGYTNHLGSLMSPDKDLEYNCINNLRFLQACKTYNPRVKIIYLGTRSQYGRAAKRQIKENHPMYPLDFHSAHKILGEFYHSLFGTIFNLSTVTLRITNVYGPRQDMRQGNCSIINKFIREIIDGDKVKIFGNGLRVKDFLYIDDAVDALLLIGKHKYSATAVYNLGGEAVKIKEPVKNIIKFLGKGSFDIIPFPKKLKKIDAGDIILDNSKIRKELGWRPRTTLKAGVDNTIRFYLKNKKNYW